MAGILGSLRLWFEMQRVGKYRPSSRDKELERVMSLKTINRILKVADNFIDKGVTALIISGGVLITLTVVLQVILRYIFKVPLFGLEEFSRLIAVWVYFLGAIFGTKWDSHVQGDVAGRLFQTQRSRSVIKSLVWALSLLVSVLFFITPPLTASGFTQPVKGPPVCGGRGYTVSAACFSAPFLLPSIAWPM